MELHVHIHYHGLEKIEHKLNHLINLNTKTMATIAELNQRVSDLQLAVDTEQQEIADALGKLNAEVQRLNDIIQSGGGATPEELQTVVDNISAVIADVQSTIPNLPPPTEPEA